MSVKDVLEVGSDGMGDAWGPDPALLAYAAYRELILATQYSQIAQEVSGIVSPQPGDSRKTSLGDPWD